jgi:hypothetical protein
MRVKDKNSKPVMVKISKGKVLNVRIHLVNPVKLINANYV